MPAGQPAGQTLAQLVGWSYRRTRDSPTFYVSLGFFLRSGNARVREVLTHGDQAPRLAVMMFTQLTEPAGERPN